jgi:hypothetical protein
VVKFEQYVLQSVTDFIPSLCSARNLAELSVNKACGPLELFKSIASQRNAEPVFNVSQLVMHMAYDVAIHVSMDQ